MKVSFYKEGLGWHGRSDTKVESVCIEFGGKKVYVFNNKKTHTVGVNIFDYSKGDQKILSFNEPNLSDVEDMDEEFVDHDYVDPFAVTKEALQRGRTSLQHGRKILNEIKGEGFSMVPGNVEVLPQHETQAEQVKKFLESLGIPVIEVPMTKQQFMTGIIELGVAQQNPEQKEARDQFRKDQRG